MRVVFFGTPDFAVPSLKELLVRHEVLAVATQPDKPKGRHLKQTASAVKRLAMEAGVPVFEPESLRDEGFYRSLLAFAPELIVVAAYGKIIPRSLLELPQYGCINIHASLLPKYRGAAPIQRVLMAGERLTGITIMKMDEGLDTGAVLRQQSTEIEAEDDSASLTTKLADIGRNLLIETIDDLERGAVVPIEQDDRSATYAAPIAKEERIIDWSRAAAEISNLIRGLAPSPSAYTLFRGKRLLINNASARISATPGAGILLVRGEQIIVGCGRDLLELKTIQPEGKRRMSAEEFERGYRPKTGESLGE